MCVCVCVCVCPYPLCVCDLAAYIYTCMRREVTFGIALWKRYQLGTNLNGEFQYQIWCILKKHKNLVIIIQ